MHRKLQISEWVSCLVLVSAVSILWLLRCTVKHVHQKLPPHIWSLMSHQLNPVEQHQAAQSDMVVRKCFCSCHHQTHKCYDGPSAGCGLLWTWSEQFSLFPVSTVTPTQQISRESETLPREYAVASPGVLKSWPFPSQAGRVTPTLVLCCLQQCLSLWLNSSLAWAN